MLGFVRTAARGNSGGFFFPLRVLNETGNGVPLAARPVVVNGSHQASGGTPTRGDHGAGAAQRPQGAGRPAPLTLFYIVTISETI